MNDEKRWYTNVKLVGQPELARNKQIFEHYVHPKKRGFIKSVLFLLRKNQGSP